MIEVPVIIGSDVVREGNWVLLLDSLLKSRFRLRRIRERALCHNTQVAISVPYFTKTDTPSTYVPDQGLGSTGRTICLLLETDMSFPVAHTTLTLIDESKGPHSIRSQYGADLTHRKRLFLFYPKTIEHAALMRKAVF